MAGPSKPSRTSKPIAVPEKVEPVCIGPTWQRDPDHPTGYAHPKRTLGWAALYWTYKWLLGPAGTPWLCTPEQERFVLWWYAVDEHGRFLYRDGCLQRLKGWGKDPLGAVLCGIEFVGPSRVDPSGETVEDPWGGVHPAGVAHPQAWVQTAAVSITQTKNTMTLLPAYFSKRMLAEYEIDLGKEIVYAHHGAQRIEAVTSSPRTLEGARSTFVLRNETHHWLSTNEGHEMNAVIDRNLTKAPDGQARALSITNAYEPGEESVGAAGAGVLRGYRRRPLGGRGLPLRLAGGAARGYAGPGDATGYPGSHPWRRYLAGYPAHHPRHPR